MSYQDQIHFAQNEKVCWTISHFCSPTFCSLSHNKIKEEGAHALCESLQVNQSLQELESVHDLCPTSQAVSCDCVALFQTHTMLGTGLGVCKFTLTIVICAQTYIHTARSFLFNSNFLTGETKNLLCYVSAWSHITVHIQFQLFHPLCDIIYTMIQLLVNAPSDLSVCM